MKNIITHFPKMKFICILLILIAVAVAQPAPTPPAIIWGAELPHSTSIFEVLTMDMLIELLLPLQSGHMIVVYFASELSPSDFNCRNCYPQLQRVKRINYYGQVEGLLSALRLLAGHQQHSVLWYNKSELLDMSCHINEICAYNFTNRHLRKHDNLMAAISRRLSYCPLIQIYTGHWEHWQALKRRRARVQHIENRQFLARQFQIRKKRARELTVLRHKQAMLAVGRIVMAVEQKRGLDIYYNRTEMTIGQSNTSLQLHQLSAAEDNRGYKLVMSSSLGLIKLHLLQSKGNWYISSLELGENSTFHPRDLLFFGNRFSFCCRCFTVYNKVGQRLSFYHFHLDIVKEPKFSAMDADYIPKRCWTCEGFLTPAINQGIFTTLLLLSMLCIGLSMLLTIGRPKRIPSLNDADLFTKRLSEQ